MEEAYRKLLAQKLERKCLEDLGMNEFQLHLGPQGTKGE